MKPSGAEARLQRARARAKAGDFAAALAHYDAALAGDLPDPLLHEARAGHGAALLGLGRADEAVATLQAAWALAPGDAALGAFLALALHAAGHGAASLGTLLTALLDLAGRQGGLDDTSAALLERACRSLLESEVARSTPKEPRPWPPRSR